VTTSQILVEDQDILTLSVAHCPCSSLVRRSSFLSCWCLEDATCVPHAAPLATEEQILGDPQMLLEHTQNYQIRSQIIIANCCRLVSTRAGPVADLVIQKYGLLRRPTTRTIAPFGPSIAMNRSKYTSLDPWCMYHNPAKSCWSCKLKVYLAALQTGVCRQI
jgi:hypothetical protein